MANKKTKKKSEQAAAPASSAKAEAKKADSKKVDSKKADNKKADSKKDAKSAKTKKNGKPGLITRAKNYFSAVRSEMKRVVWPSKKELTNYSVAVILSLLVVGVVIAGLDAVISGGLVLIAG